MPLSGISCLRRSVGYKDLSARCAANWPALFKVTVLLCQRPAGRLLGALKVRMVWRGFPLTGSLPVTARSSQCPGLRSRRVPGPLYRVVLVAMPDSVRDWGNCRADTSGRTEKLGLTRYGAIAQLVRAQH
jgi:hypothetical protein